MVLFRFELKPNVLAEIQKPVKRLKFQHVRSFGLSQESILSKQLMTREVIKELRPTEVAFVGVVFQIISIASP